MHTANHSMYTGRKRYFASSSGNVPTRFCSSAIIRQGMISAWRSTHFISLFHSKTKAYPLSISRDEVRIITGREEGWEGGGVAESKGLSRRKKEPRSERSINHSFLFSLTVLKRDRIRRRGERTGLSLSLFLGAEDIYIYKTAKDKTCTVHRLSVSDQCRTRIVSFSSLHFFLAQRYMCVDECARLRLLSFFPLSFRRGRPES